MKIGKDKRLERKDTINVDSCPPDTIEVVIKSRETGQNLKKCLSKKYLSRFVLVSGRAFKKLSPTGVGSPVENIKLFLTVDEYDTARNRYSQLGKPFERAIWKKIDTEEIKNN